MEQKDVAEVIADVKVDAEKERIKSAESWQSELRKQLNIEITLLTNWHTVRQLARDTVNKKDIAKPVSDKFKLDILKSEHSPIRALYFTIRVEGIPYFSAMHFRTHKKGVEFFISTQRTDRTNVSRDKKPQDAPVTMTMLINAQAILNISRKRLCKKADKVTRFIWEEVVKELYKSERILAMYCVPQCVYCKGCREPQPCGFYSKLTSY